MAMTALPSGTVTFLFTDIEGSTLFWQRDRAAMAAAVTRHLIVLDTAIQAHGGFHFKTIGDAVQVAFATAPAAVAGALAAQRGLLAEDWGASGPLRVRMALHAGEAAPDEHGDYRAPALNRLARLIAAGHGGQILLSSAVQLLARDALPPGTSLRDLGEHRLRDLLEPQPVYQLLHPDLPSEFPPLNSLDTRPHNLPLQPTPFLGREREVDETVALLRRPDVRLLTLTGPGGTGKTRLALQAAAELVENFSDGVFFVSLAPLRDPHLVPSAIATALGIREESDQPLWKRLRQALATKQILLVLDNVEHLVEVAPAIGELLAACPGLKVLATSRLPLRLRGEREYPVPPLTLPPASGTAPEQLLQSEAVRLFVARAHAVRAEFTLTPDTAPAVAEITRRLDGLPLAIELAAARVRLLPPAALLARLEKRLPLLTGGPRDAPARQQTLRDAIAWSYDLLSGDEQALFRRLAIFAGGFSMEAAEAVANPRGERDILDGLDQLSEHSLLRSAEDDGEPRFTMLETIREYGLERLAQSGDEEATRRAHAAFFLTLAMEADAALRGPNQGIWFERLETEQDNFRSALGWALTGQPETALGLVAALYGFWSYRGNFTEARDWTERGLATGASAAPDVRAQALNWSSRLAWRRANYETASSRAEEALALARSVDDRSSEAWALMNLGSIANALGDVKRATSLSAEAEACFVSIGDRHGAAMAIIDQATVAGAAGDVDRRQELLERSLAEFRAIGDRIEAASPLFALGRHELEQGHLDRARTLLKEVLETAREFRLRLFEAYALHALAEVAIEHGDSDQATTYLQDAEAKFRELGHGLTLASGLNHAGYLALRQGNHAQARRLIEEAVSLTRDFGATAATANSLHSLGDVFRASSDVAGAAVHYREALVLAQNVHDMALVTACLAGLAGLAGTTGRNQEAARFFGVVEALQEAVGIPNSRYEEKRLNEDKATVREALGLEADARARAAGRALALDAAVSETLALADELAHNVGSVSPNSAVDTSRKSGAGARES
jgi:predicted ATPase/class 3 adenylate cyclase